METNENIESSIEEIKKQVKEIECLEEGSYVILVYEMYNNPFIPDRRRMLARFMYRNISEFESKVRNDIQKIDDSLGLYFEWRTFD